MTKMMLDREKALDLLCVAYQRHAWAVEHFREIVDQWMTDAYEAGRKKGCPTCSAHPTPAEPK